MTQFVNTRRHMTPPDRGNVRPRAAFTLVEMLVATGLVVLIMTMFAQIYGTTINTMTMQRGMANNDQKARAVSNLILADLRMRTYREANTAIGHSKGIVPLVDESTLLFDMERQKGFFYYSENDPHDDTDDVLQFTAMVGTAASVGDETTDSSRVFLGRARNLNSGGADPVVSQPDLDDGVSDDRSQSRAAEICYFLRGGNLYRRVFLLRDLPYSPSPIPTQPTRNLSDPVFGDPTYSAAVTPPVANYETNNPIGIGTVESFWSDFDYSATRFFYDLPNDSSYVWFNSVESLNNSYAGPGFNPIALPWNRFGHYNNWTGAVSPDNIPANEHHGCPREYVGSLTAPQFIGRLTAEETSSAAMGYPGTASPAAFSRNTGGDALNNDGAITNYANGYRVGEDILLSNVEAFNVEYWDDTSDNIAEHRFVSLGAVSGPWSNNRNPRYGPVVPSASRANRVFDTWHPQAFSVDSGGGGVNRLPPRFPRYSDLVAAGDIYDSWIDDVPHYTAMDPQTVPLGSVLRLPSHERGTIVYKAIRSGVSIEVTPSPDFPPTIGNIVEEADLDVDNPGVVWQCIDNRIGLKAIRITIRFRDPGKEMPRQVTLVHSFVE